MDRGKEDEDEEGEGGWRVLRWSMEVGAIALFLSPSPPPPSLVVEAEADCAKKKKKEIGDRGYTPASSGCISKGESGLPLV